MSILNPRVRATTSQRMRIVATIAAAVPALVLAACSDASLPITAPPRAPGQVASNAPGDRPPSLAAALVFCDVAMRAPSGEYRHRSMPIKVSRDIFDPSGKTVKVGFRGWVKGASDPTSLTLCQIPATEAAAEFFNNLFSVDASLAPPEANWAPATATPTSGGPRRAYATAAAVPVYDAAPACELTAIICDPVPDPVPVPEWEGPPPLVEEPPDVPMGDAPLPMGVAPYIDGTGLYYAAVISCYGQTDYPHLSGTPGFFGNVNVHGRTVCNIPTSISVTTSLSRQKCFWIFCWWSGVGYGANARFGTFVETNAASAGCSRGWYKGSSFHTAAYPSGPAYAWTANYNYVYC